MPDNGTLDKTFAPLSLHINSLTSILFITLLPDALQDACEFSGWSVKDGHVTPLPIELAAVLLGEASGIHEGGKRRFHFRGGENEDLGRCGWVEPALYPAPDSGEEDGGTDYLVAIDCAKSDQLCDNNSRFLLLSILCFLILVSFLLGSSENIEEQ